MEPFPIYEFCRILTCPIRSTTAVWAEYTIEGMHMYANGYKSVLDQMIPILAALK